jgi:hypothetical protein
MRSPLRGRRFLGSVVAGLMVMSIGVAVPSAVRADPTLPGEFYGTAYYLGQGHHPTAGPCWDGGGNMSYQRPLETDPGGPFPNDRTTWGTFTQPYYYESKHRRFAPARRHGVRLTRPTNSSLQVIG